MARRTNRRRDAEYTAVVGYNLSIASITAIQREARRYSNNRSLALDSMIKQWMKWDADTRRNYREWIAKMNEKGGEEE